MAPFNPMDTQENRRILAVDDEEGVLAHYRTIFTPSDRKALLAQDQLYGVLEDGSETEPNLGAEQPTYLLDCFSQGMDAVAAVEASLKDQQPYAVALIDMRMQPGIDGLETAQRIRLLDSEVNIIFITAYSDYTTDKIFHQISGSVLWFRKPFHTGEIVQAVRNSCDQWHQAYELEQLRQDLAYRVDLQTERLQSKVKSLSILQRNSLKRELKMGEMKRQIYSLKAFQDLRLLLSSNPLPEPDASNTEFRPVELLLVDDTSSAHSTYLPQLTAIGFQVMVAGSFDEAFKLATRSSTEVVLIGICLSGDCGKQLITQLRDDSHTLYTLPLLLTNRCDEMVAVEAGAAYCINKGHPAFLNQMELVRDYVQKNRSLQSAYIPENNFSENRRVLLVDDEPQDLDLLQNCLRSEGDPSGMVPLEEFVDKTSRHHKVEESLQQRAFLPFEITVLNQGLDAVAAVREAQFVERPFAVAVIDTQMSPGIDGLETARQIRQISPQIDIVMLKVDSDYSLNQIRQVLGGNFSLLEKPLKKNEIQQLVVEGCAKWAIAHEVNTSNQALLNLAEDLEQENILRREVEEQLLQASHAKDDFLSNLSHELRTPLTSIIANSEFLAEELVDPGQEQQQIIKCIEVAGRNQLALVNDILDLSKIESGKFTIDKTLYDLSSLLEDLEHIFLIRAKTLGSELTIEQRNSEHFQLIGDPQRITQILINLLGNAIKFTQKGVISLTTEVRDQWLCFIVKDNGIGMSPEATQKLFKKFEQADGSISRRFGGSGLGLFISLNLSEMMGGHIEVESEKGVGSTFTLTLPYRPSEEPIPEHSTGSSDRQHFSGTVLLAEDTPDIQQVIIRMLEKRGVTVTAANNGQEVLDQALVTPFDLILMDMQMPVMGGVEATEMLRSLGCDTPVVALTANVMKRHRDLFEQAGANDFLNKPIHQQELNRVLQHYLKPDDQSEQAVEDDEPLISDELRILFIERVIEQRKVLPILLREQNWPEIRLVAHNMKGSCDIYGYSEIADTGKNISDEIDAGSYDVVVPLVSQLIEQLGGVE